MCEKSMALTYHCSVILRDCSNLLEFTAAISFQIIFLLFGEMPRSLNTKANLLARFPWHPVLLPAQLWLWTEQWDPHGIVSFHLAAAFRAPRSEVCLLALDQKILMRQSGLSQVYLDPCRTAEVFCWANTALPILGSDTEKVLVEQEDLASNKNHLYLPNSE